MERRSSADPPFVYRGWTVMWTGWKTVQDSFVLASQWAARNRLVHPDKMLYSSAPGGSGWLSRFGKLDTAFKAGQILPTADSPAEDLECAKMDAKAILIKLIDEAAS